MTPILLLLSLTACAPGLRDTTFATGSRTLVTDAAREALYIVDTDGGTVVRTDPATGATVSVEVGAEPTRIARAGGQLFVTLRAERAVAVVEDRSGSLVTVGRIQVGAEPVGVVAREDGTRVYVALSAEDAVVEIDTASLSVSRRFAVEGHPSWLALHPSGAALYVGGATGGRVAWVDLDDGSVAELDLPAIRGAGVSGDAAFTRRVTGDPSVAPDGDAFAIPAIFLDNTNPVADPGEGAIVSDGYGSVGIGVSRFNPAVIVVPVDERSGNPAPDEAATVLVAGFGEIDGAGTATRAVRSYLVSATYAPDGESIYAAMEASSAVAVVSAHPAYPEATTDTGALSAPVAFMDTGGAVFLSADQAGFAASPIVLVGTDAGPRGVSFLDDDRAFVHAFLDRTVGSVKAGRAGGTLLDAIADDDLGSRTFSAPEAFAYAASTLPPEVEAGRRLFFSATASQMAADGAGVSCSTCHAEGRNDGLTWSFEDGVRQTPSLAGAVSGTAPFTWTDAVASVGDEAQITSAGRMGGAGLTYGEAAQVAAYIESIRAVDLPEKGSTSAAAQRGRAIFERADVGCATCHSGERFTDNDHHAMYGLTAVNTPSLVGVAFTAPYLHDGSAADLTAVVDGATGGGMGDTSMLSSAERADLVAYLKSL